MTVSNQYWPNVFTPVLGSDWVHSLRAPDAHQQEEQHPCRVQLHRVLGSVPHAGQNHHCRAPAGVCRSWAADKRKNEEEQGLILELPHARSVPRRFSSLLCGITASSPLTELGGPAPSLRLWLPGSAQLAGVQRGTWKANPAEHADCRQSPRNSTEKRWHVQSKKFQKENWLSFGRSSYKIKTLPLCQRSPADKFQVHVPVQRCTTIFQRDCHKKGTIILLRFLKTDEEFWLNALNKLKPKAKERHQAFQSKRLQLSSVINNQTQHLLKNCPTIIYGNGRWRKHTGGTDDSRRSSRSRSPSNTLCCGSSQLCHETKHVSDAEPRLPQPASGAAGWWRAPRRCYLPLPVTTSVRLGRTQRRSSRHTWSSYLPLRTLHWLSACRDKRSGDINPRCSSKKRQCPKRFFTLLLYSELLLHSPAPLSGGTGHPIEHTEMRTGPATAPACLPHIPLLDLPLGTISASWSMMEREKSTTCSQPKPGYCWI